MSAFWHHFSFEFKTGLRNSTAMLMNYLFPLGFYVLMGLIMVQINPGFKDTLISSLTLVAIMAAALLGLPGPLVESRDAGIYRSFKINGVPAVSILTIPTVTTIIHALIVSTLIAVTAAPLFKGLNPSSWGAYAAVTLLAALNIGSVGALIGVIASGARSTVLWSQLIFLPAMLLGGLMMPLDMLPQSALPVSALLPTTYAMQAYQGLAWGRATVLDPWLSVGILAAGAVLAFGLAVYLFSWDSANQTRRASPLLALLAWVPYIAGAMMIAVR